MDLATFEATVKRLEAQAGENPGAYRRKVFGLVLLGYIYVVGVLAVTAALILLCIWEILQGRLWGLAFKVFVGLCAFFGLVWSSLRVRMPKLEGRVVTESEAPALFAAVERVRTAVGAPKLDAVFVDGAFNAGVAQHPRRGILGGYRNCLVVGLPMLAALSPTQFDAVLAHEFGHLAGAHGKIGAWIYRIRGAWGSLNAKLVEKKATGGFVFRPFMRWYFPRFNAHTFVHARGVEYEADRVSARVVGTREAADALVATSIRGRFLAQRFWPEIYGKAGHEPTPSDTPYARILSELPAAPHASDEPTTLNASMGEATGIADTHPCLADRLASLREAARMPPRPRRSAADVYLGPLAGTLAAEFDRLWASRIEKPWVKEFDTAQEERTRLAELDEQAGAGMLPLDLAWERAYLTERRRGPADATPLYDALILSHPDHAPALFARGRLLLAAGDDAGLGFLHRAMSHDPQATRDACGLAVAFLRARGRTAEGAEFERKARERAEIVQRAAVERANFAGDGPFEPHGLSDEGLAPLRRQFDLFPDLKRAWLLRKPTELSPALPIWVLVAERDPGIKQAAGGAGSDAELRRQLAEILRLPGQGFVVVPALLPARKRTTLTTVPDSQIWPAR